MRPGMPSMSGSPPPLNSLGGPGGPRMPNPQQPMSFGHNSDFNSLRPPSAGAVGGIPTTGTDMLRKQLEQNQAPNSMQPIKSPMNNSQLLGAMGQSSLTGNSLLMAQLEKQPPCNPDPKVINQVAGTLANKVPTDNLHNLLPNQQQQQHMGNNSQHNNMDNSSIGKMEIKTEDDIKREIKDEPMDSFPDTSGQGDEMQQQQVIKKEEIKSEDDIKTEGGAGPSADSAPSAAGTSKAVEKVESGSSEPSAASKLPLGTNKIIFAPERLKDALEPPLMKLYNHEPESIPFRVPVDPNALGIPDYFEIVKKPMDMTTIKKKLDTGAYTDPWEYIEDVWQMFENAWIYNRKTSRVYKYCSKVKINDHLQIRSR